MRVDRNEVLRGTAASGRVQRAEAQASAYAAFRSRFDLDDIAEALPLYLTTLLDEGLSTRAIWERLHLLDLDRRLRGLTPWHRDPDVRTFLRGLSADRPVGDRHSHYDLLYLEFVHAMVDACRVPTPDQRRARRLDRPRMTWTEQSCHSATSLARRPDRNAPGPDQSRDEGRSRRTHRSNAFAWRTDR
jgi:hypothetical protein